MVPNSASVGGACGGGQISAPGVSHSGNRDSLNDNSQKIKILKISDQGDASKMVVCCALALFTVINFITGQSILAYLQHDTASQATLISDRLRNKLDLETVSNLSVSIKTLSNQTVITEGRRGFSLESFSTADEFSVQMLWSCLASVVLKAFFLTQLI